MLYTLDIYILTNQNAANLEFMVETSCAKLPLVLN